MGIRERAIGTLIDEVPEVGILWGVAKEGFARGRLEQKLFHVAFLARQGGRRGIRERAIGTCFGQWMCGLERAVAKEGFASGRLELIVVIPKRRVIVVAEEGFASGRLERFLHHWESLYSTEVAKEGFASGRLELVHISDGHKH